MDLFERVMLRVDRVRPDVFAPTVLINACGRAGFLEKASHLFLLLERLDLPAHPKTITGTNTLLCDSTCLCPHLHLQLHLHLISATPILSSAASLSQASSRRARTLPTKPKA